MGKNVALARCKEIVDGIIDDLDKFKQGTHPKASVDSVYTRLEEVLQAIEDAEREYDCKTPY